MTWDYFMRPRAPEGYPPEAIQEMAAHVRCWPVHQRADGCFVLFEDETTRDEIVAARGDGPYDGREHVWIKRDEVVLGVDHNYEGNALLAKFMEWSMSKWPADLLDAGGRPRTVPEFLKELHPYGR